jgi:hypothetical protein
VRVQQIFNRLQNHKVLKYLIEDETVNSRLITNPEISFEKYFEVLFRNVETKITKLKG